MTLDLVTSEQHQAVVRRLEQLETLVVDLLTGFDDEVDTATALKLTGIKSASTLITERQRLGTLLKYTKNGRSVSYSRTSCLAYKRQHQRLGACPPTGQAA